MKKYLTPLAQLSLFITSYIPLFLLIVVKQFSNNITYLKWGGLTRSSFWLFLKMFWLSIALLLVSFLAILATNCLLKNLHKGAVDGFEVRVIDTKNLGSEAVGYIGTYIIPFLFQGYNSWAEIVALFILLFIIYRVYVNSSMILVNPFLAMRYPILEVVVENPQEIKSTCMIITKEKSIEDNSIIRLNRIGHKLYYARKMHE